MEYQDPIVVVYRKVIQKFPYAKSAISVIYRLPWTILSTA
jgi:hypothetical protein